MLIILFGYKVSGVDMTCYFMTAFTSTSSNLDAFYKHKYPNLFIKQAFYSHNHSDFLIKQTALFDFI